MILRRRVTGCVLGRTFGRLHSSIGFDVVTTGHAGCREYAETQRSGESSRDVMHGVLLRFGAVHDARSVAIDAMVATIWSSTGWLG